MEFSNVRPGPSIVSSGSGSPRWIARERSPRICAAILGDLLGKGASRSHHEMDNKPADHKLRVILIRHPTIRWCSRVLAYVPLNRPTCPRMIQLHLRINRRRMRRGLCKYSHTLHGASLRRCTDVRDNNILGGHRTGWTSTIKIPMARFVVTNPHTLVAHLEMS